MNYHVFIVDENTFKYHLEYMFAGTGAKNKTISFLTDYSTTMHWAQESSLIGMIADISRIRIGDKIIFYLQSTQDNPGMFYGIFKASSTAFFDENDSSNYLKDNLCKPLTFRIKIASDCIYPVGVSEHDYLDSLQSVEFPFQICWSLIYRKLKGNRGCTMITDYEFKSLVSKLKLINNNNCLGQDLPSITFNNTLCTIQESTSVNQYTGRTERIDIKARLLFKANKYNSFEIHLQAYILQNFDKEPLASLLLPYCNIPCWIGNEVSCGLGMQRIDLMIIQTNNSDVYIKVIELKCIKPSISIFDKQLPWYIHWIIDYVAPNYMILNKKVHIIPCIIAANATESYFLNRCQDFHLSYKITNKISVEPAEYISFSLNANDITFQRII